MEEFLKLLLTGQRKKTFLKFSLTYGILTAVQLLLAVVGIALSVNLSGTAAVVAGGVASALVAALAVALVILRSRRDAVYFGLIAQQRECDKAELAGENLTLRENIYEKFFSVFKPERRVRKILPCAAWSVLFVAGGILSALAGAGLLGDALFVSLLVLEAGLLLLIVSVALAGSHKQCVDLYDIADGDIEQLKRNAGMSQRAIDRDRFYVLGFVYRFQEAFLCDAYDRRDLRRIVRNSTLAYALITAVTLAALLTVAMLTKEADAAYFVTVLCIAATAFALFCATAIIADRKRAVIYHRNSSKLTQSPEDETRRKMQAEFVSLQKRGNRMFAGIIVVGTLIGLIYGGICGLILPDINLFKNALGWALITLLISIIISLAVWIVMYALYRKAVKPLENKLQIRNAE